MALHFPLVTWDHESRQPTFLIVLGVFLAISLTTVSASIGVDDWIIGAAMCVGIALGIQNGIHVSYGTGMHLADFPEDLTAAFIPTLKHWYSYQIVYPLALALIKASILATYWRIFTQSTFPRLYLLACGGIIGVYTVIFMFVFAFECATLSDAWDPIFVTGPPECINRDAAYFSAAAVHIATDVIILVMPIRPFSKLSMNARRRYALMAIFLVGSVAVIASCVRLYFLVWHATDSEDGPYDAIYILLWSQIEINVAITCASVPALRPLFARAFSGSQDSASREYPAPSIAGSRPNSGGGLLSRPRRSTGIELRFLPETDRNEIAPPKAQYQSDNDSEEMILGKDPGRILRTVEMRIGTSYEKDNVAKTEGW